MSLIFDIETEPMSELELQALCPPFDPAKVKMGNVKDPVKVRQRLEEAEASHFADFCADAALDAGKSRLLAVGIHRANAEIIWNRHDESEWALIRGIWDRFSDESVVIGFNILGFDLPYLVRRSWLLGVPIPKACRNGGRFSSGFVDIMKEWQCQNYREEFVSLDRLARMFGVGEKTGSGADFHKLAKSDPAAATEYLLNDLKLTKAIAERMGLLNG